MIKVHLGWLLGCRTGGFSTSEGGNPNLDGFPETWKTQPVILETLPFSNISKQLFCLLFLLLTSANILPVSGSQIAHLPYFWWLDQAHQGCLNPDMLQIYVYTSIYPSLPTLAPMSSALEATISVEPQLKQHQGFTLRVSPLRCLNRKGVHH